MKHKTQFKKGLSLNSRVWGAFHKKSKIVLKHYSKKQFFIFVYGFVFLRSYSLRIPDSFLRQGASSGSSGRGPWTGRSAWFSSSVASTHSILKLKFEQKIKSHRKNKKFWIIIFTKIFLLNLQSNNITHKAVTQLCNFQKMQ